MNAILSLEPMTNVLLQQKSHEGAAGVFMETLWAAIVIVGFSVVVYLGLLAVRLVQPTNQNSV